MKTLEQIKDLVAKEMRYNNWTHLMNLNHDDHSIINHAMDQVCRDFAREVAYHTLKNASEKVAIIYNPNPPEGQFHIMNVYPDKQSILNTPIQLS